MADTPLTGLAARLLVNQLLDEKTIRSAQRRASQSNQSFSRQLIEDKHLSYTQLALVTAEEFGLPILDLSEFDIEHVPNEIVTENLIRKHKILPLMKRGTRLFVAIIDPTDHQAMDEIRFSTGLSVDPVLVEESKLDQFIDRVLDTNLSALDEFTNSDFGNLEELDVGAGDEASDLDTPSEDDAPVVRFVNKMLLSAIKEGASDLHFEPYEKTYRVRFRTDGVLREAAKPPHALSPKIASRLKIMSSMDISERRKPQDGRIKMKLSKNKAIDFRVNTLPTLWGEKIVLRILDPSSAKMGIDYLGYEADQKAMYMEALEQPQGMILVTGPTGSGKTVSLYTGLNILNTEERNISTAEDPVEINLEVLIRLTLIQNRGWTSLRRSGLFYDKTPISSWSVRFVTLKRPTSL